MRRWLASLGAVVALLVVGAPATAALASNAQPGQALYGTKLFVERVELTVQRDPARKMELRLRFARERLSEIELLVAEGRTARVARVLQNLDGQQGQLETAVTRLQGNRRASSALLRELSVLATQHEDGLRSLAERCPRSPLPGSQCAMVSTAAQRAAALARVLRRLERPGGGL
jgi:hypothetical protein